MDRVTLIQYTPHGRFPKMIHNTSSRLNSPFSLIQKILLNANPRNRIKRVSDDSQNSPYSSCGAESPYFAFSMKKQSAKYVNETPLKPPLPKGVTIWIWRFGSKRGFANSAKCTYRCFLIIKYPRILIHVKL